MVHDSNPSTWKAEEGGSDWGQPGLHQVPGQPGIKRDSVAKQNL